MANYNINEIFILKQNMKKADFINFLANSDIISDNENSVTMANKLYTYLPLIKTMVDEEIIYPDITTINFEKYDSTYEINFYNYKKCENGFGVIGINQQKVIVWEIDQQEENFAVLHNYNEYTSIKHLIENIQDIKEIFHQNLPKTKKKLVIK